MTGRMTCQGWRLGQPAIARRDRGVAVQAAAPAPLAGARRPVQPPSLVWRARRRRLAASLGSAVLPAPRWRWGVGLLVALALLPPAAHAQRVGCGFGLGLEAVRAAEAALAEGSQAGSLSTGRAAGAAAVAPLREAAARFAGCGCRQLGEFAGEALGLAEQAESEASLARLRGTLERARFSLGQLRDRTGRRGCI